MRPALTRPVPRLALLATLAALAGGCSRCGQKPPAAPAERWVPASASGVLVIPDVGEAQRQASALYGTLLATPGGADLAAVRTGLGAQLGFDLFDPASLESVGIDPRRSLAIAELSANPGQDVAQALLVLPVADEAKLKALVGRLATDRLGAGQQGLENANGRPIDVWRRALGEPALLSLVVTEGTALLAAGQLGPDSVRAALALDPALSLAQSPGWKKALAALGQALPVLFYLPAGSAPLRGGPAQDGAVLGVAAAARSLKLVAAGLLGGQEAQLRPLAGTGAGKAGPTSLDPDTVLAVRVSADPAAALALAGRLDPDLGAQDDLKALAAQLEPGLEVGVSLSRKADLGGAIAARGAIEPLRVARLELVAAVKDPAAVTALFDQVVKEVRGQARDGRWRVGDGPTELAWTLRGKTLAVAAGPAGGLDALLARLSAGTPGFAPAGAAGEALAGGLAGAVLSGDNLVKGLKALPPDAWGTGPDAVVTRSLVEKLSAPAGRGGSIAARADLPAGALRVALELTLGEPSPAP